MSFHTYTSILPCFLSDLELPTYLIYLNFLQHGGSYIGKKYATVEKAENRKQKVPGISILKNRCWKCHQMNS